MARATSTISPAAFSTFGELLRYLRRRQRMTQIELAIAVGYSTAQISRLEQNLRRPNPSTLQALFIPALGLEHDSELAARLFDLARVAYDEQGADATPPEPEPIDAPQESATTGSEHNVLGSAPGAHILVTKLYRPRSRPTMVVRPRLLSHLDAALQVPLTLVVAPAGFGKTTLLTSWLASRTEGRELRNESMATSLSPQSSGRSTQVAWLALDDGDNDPTSFIHYVIAAFQAIAPAAGRTSLALLQATQPPAPETVVRILVNDLAALTDECVLALDDYYRITAPAIHHVLEYLIEHLPVHVHVVIASREDPPLPLARLRARGQMVELRAADLRFTTEEAGRFLREVMGVALTADEVTALDARTEGWIAGLQLAALAMQHRVDVQSFISAFTGSNRFVVDYLAAEVFERQPTHLQTFLLQTSILDRLCGPLCDAVMGIELATSTPRAAYTQSILEDLERANLFVVPLDDERHWYRYHHLFGEVLRERLLRGAKTEDVATLHRRASAWYEGQGLVAEAMHHALAGQDWERAERIVEVHGLVLTFSGHVQTVLGWLHAFPPSLMQQYPLICVIHATGLMLTGQAEAAEAQLQDAESCLQPETPDELAHLVRSSVALARGRMRQFVGDWAQSISLVQQAVAQATATTTSVAAGITNSIGWSIAMLILGTAYQLTGDVTTTSERRLADTIAPLRATGNLSATLTGYAYLAALHVLQGRLRMAAATYAEAERLVPGSEARSALANSPAYYFGMGELLREWNDLDAAEDHLARGIALLQGALMIDADLILHGYVALARVQQAQGQGTAALATLGAFMRVARERKLFHLIVDQAVAMEVRLHLMQGDLAATVRWADASGLDPGDPIEFPREVAHLTLARVRIAQGRASDILPLLDRLLADAEAKARMHSAIEILIVLALAHHTLGDRPRALTALERALTLAEPEGYVRMFVDEGAPMLALLRAAASQGIVPTYAARLLSVEASR